MPGNTLDLKSHCCVNKQQHHHKLYCQLAKQSLSCIFFHLKQKVLLWEPPTGILRFYHLHPARSPPMPPSPAPSQILTFMTSSSINYYCYIFICFFFIADLTYMKPDNELTSLLLWGRLLLKWLQSTAHEQPCKCQGKSEHTKADSCEHRLDLLLHTPRCFYSHFWDNYTSRKFSGHALNFSFQVSLQLYKGQSCNEVLCPPADVNSFSWL